MLFTILQVNIAEVYIVKLQSTNLFELFFDTTTAHQGILQTFAHIFLLVTPIGEEQLEQTAHRTFHSNGVALIQIFAQAEILTDGTTKVLFAQFTQALREIVRDKAKGVCEMFRAEFGNLPTGEIVMETVEKCRINHLLREG